MFVEVREKPRRRRTDDAAALVVKRIGSFRRSAHAALRTARGLPGASRDSTWPTPFFCEAETGLRMSGGLQRSTSSGRASNTS